MSNSSWIEEIKSQQVPELVKYEMLARESASRHKGELTEEQCRSLAKAHYDGKRAYRADLENIDPVLIKAGNKDKDQEKARKSFGLTRSLLCKDKKKHQRDLLQHREKLLASKGISLSLIIESMDILAEDAGLAPSNLTMETRPAHSPPSQKREYYRVIRQALPSIKSSLLAKIVVDFVRYEFGKTVGAKTIKETLDAFDKQASNKPDAHSIHAGLRQSTNK